MKKTFLFFIWMFLPFVTNADEIEIEGISYNLITKGNAAEVLSVSGELTGDLCLPGIIVYDGKEYTVTAIKGLHNNNLTSVSIPEGVMSIGSYAISGDNLSSITLPSTLNKVEYRAFWGCNLSSVNISSIESWCMISFSMDSNPLSSASHLYCNGTEIKDLVIQEGVTSICSYAFEGFIGLSSVSILGSVKKIGAESFRGCNKIESVSISDDVSVIESGAFRDCGELTSVQLGRNVSSVSSVAFANCKKLTDVYCHVKNVPNTFSNAFEDSYIEYVTLHVPEGCVEAYRSVEPWSSFKEIISIEGTKYTLSYIVDGEEYKTYELGEGDEITPEPAPSKEGYLFSGWSTIPATMPAEDVTITGSFQLITDDDVITLKESGKGTWCSDYDLDFTDVEGIKAYTATGYDDIKKTIWLTRVFSVPAGTGIMVKGDPGEHKIPHATVKAVYASFFKGVTGTAVTINETDGDNTNYYMAGGQFKKVNGSTTISPNRAYLQLPTLVFAGTRSIDVIYEDEIDDKTGIHSAAITSDQEPGIYYNLQGQRVDNPKKGLYIKNGKKVIIK